MSRKREAARQARLLDRGPNARVVRVTKKTSITTCSGVITFEQWHVYNDPALLSLVDKFKVPHEEL